MVFLDKVIALIIYIGMPVVGLYHEVHESAFLNIAAEDAIGVERAGNAFLMPVQYLLAGKKAVKLEQEGSYQIEPNFDYSSDLTLKLCASVLFIHPSLLIGGGLKAIAFFSEGGKERYEKLTSALSSKKVISKNAYYEQLGIDLSHWEKGENIHSPIHERNPGAENYMSLEKECFKQIVSLLNENKIVYWADCGTCLGAYRYRGIIPWDEDVDLAVLKPDFTNVRNALKALDQSKYSVQDWSSRDKPNTYLRVYIKETRTHIDIYHFAIDSKNKTVASILSNEDSAFMPESWKMREGRFVVTTPFEVVFPLRKANFDGIEIFVPSQTKEYLQLRYGENIEPAKIYNPVTNSYEKDRNHPYWKDSYVK